MNERAASPPGRQWVHPGMAAFVALIWLATLPLRPLFNPDEGRYAEIPREMLQGGDWVIPHLNGLPYIEKPPLQYWATALSFGALGENEFSARLYTALTALGTLAVVWTLARRLWDEDAAWRAAAVLCSLSLFPVLGQLLTLDMSLTFFMTLSLAGFLSAQPPPRRECAASTRQPAEPPVLLPRSEHAPRPADAHGSARAEAPPTAMAMRIAWAAAACGVLTKGLVAAAIPAGVLVLYTVVSRDTAVWRRLHLRSGLPLFLVITVPWHWLAAARQPDFLEFFFVHEHLQRFLTSVADRGAAWWFFGAVFLAGSLPWTLSAVRIMATGWRRQPTGAFDHGLFLWLWIVFVFGFFSVSDSKLIPYVLPALPAVALLIAASPPATVRRDVTGAAIITLVAASALAASSLIWPRLIAASDRSRYLLQLPGPLLQIAALLGASAGFAVFRRARAATGAAVFLGAGWCLGILLLMRAAAAVAPAYSGRGLAAAVPAADRGVPIYSVATYDQTLPFYLGRTVRLVAYRGEFDYGLRHGAGGEIGGVEAFVARWTAESGALAVMETDLFDELRGRRVPMRELGRDVHRVLVSRQ